MDHGYGCYDVTNHRIKEDVRQYTDTDLASDLTSHNRYVLLVCEFILDQ